MNIMLVVKKTDVNSEDAKLMLNELNEALKSILGHDGTKHVNLSDFEHERAGFFVGYDGKKPVCCAGIRYENSITGEVKRVYTRKNSKGYGRQMMCFLEKWATENGYNELILECRSGNPHALRFYSECGYSVCENYPPYDSEDDAVCMKKTMKQ